MKNISYGLRNTIVLFVVFVALAGSGWTYIEFVQNKQINQLKITEQKVKQKLQKDQSIASRYHDVLYKYVDAQKDLNHFPKTLSSKLRTYDVYEFLDKASQGDAYTDLNFTFLKTTSSKTYGIISARVSGTGYYKDVYNLVRTIEYSYPLVKVKKLVINPYNGEKKSSFSQVAFTFELESYYDLTGEFKEKNISVTHAGVSRIYNPFYPLIHGIPPNINNLPNVEKSQLVGVGIGIIYIIDQDGHVQKLKVGAPVYLGHLASVDLEHKSATFYLNKGGIFDKVTLKVQ